MPATPPEREPDARFTLANERTFLAWQRTALALLAGAVAVQQLGEDLEPAWARPALGLLCIAMSLLTSVGGLLRWRAVERAVRTGAPLPPLPLAPALTAGAVLLAALAALLVLR